MRGMREVEVTPTAAGRFEAVIGGDRFSQFSQLADTTRERFLGRTIWNINAADDGFEPAGSSGGDLDFAHAAHLVLTCLLYTSPSPRDRTRSRMPSSA